MKYKGYTYHGHVFPMRNDLNFKAKIDTIGKQHENAQVGNDQEMAHDQEMAQSERNFHSTNRGGTKLI